MNRTALITLLLLAGCNPTGAPCVEPTVVEACEAQLIARCDAFADCCDAAALDCDPWVYDPATCLAEWQSFGVDCSTADPGTASCASVEACEMEIANVECSVWLGGGSPNLETCVDFVPR